MVLFNNKDLQDTYKADQQFRCGNFHCSTPNGGNDSCDGFCLDFPKCVLDYADFLAWKVTISLIINFLHVYDSSFAVGKLWVECV